MLAPDLPLPAVELPESQMPRFRRVRQRFPRPRLEDVAGRARAELRRLLGGRLRPGARVAITAGSRGIANIVALLAAAADEVRAAGGDPFFVAAMGSHGGGTVEGQRAVLASLGITEEAVRAPLRIGTETVSLGRTPIGFEAHCDRLAAEADAILVINRVKPHTAFRGPNESGLLKMLAIGLGKVPGASAAHRLGAAEMARAVREAARLICARLPVLGGLAVVENGYEETAMISALPVERMEEGERALLETARALLPRLPLPSADLLIVGEMGKNISGTGIDVNVTGRWGLAGEGVAHGPDIARIVVLELSAASHGNANGVGLADFVTRRLAERIDPLATYLNALTTGYVDRARLPMVLEDDRAAIGAALRTLGLADPREARAMWVRNTLRLEELWVSEAALAELPPHAVAIGPSMPLRFVEGRLAWPEGDEPGA